MPKDKRIPSPSIIIDIHKHLLTEAIKRIVVDCVLPSEHSDEFVLVVYNTVKKFYTDHGIPLPDDCVEYSPNGERVESSALHTRLTGKLN